MGRHTKVIFLQLTSLTNGVERREHFDIHGLVQIEVCSCFLPLAWFNAVEPKIVEYSICAVKTAHSFGERGSGEYSMYTLHSTLCTLCTVHCEHSVQYTLYTLYSKLCTLCKVHCVHSVQYTVWTLYSTLGILCTVHCVHYVQYTVYTLCGAQCTLCHCVSSVHCTVHCVHSILYTLTLCTVHCVHCTLCTALGAVAMRNTSRNLQFSLHSKKNKETKENTGIIRLDQSIKSLCPCGGWRQHFSSRPYSPDSPPRRTRRRCCWAAWAVVARCRHLPTPAKATCRLFCRRCRSLSPMMAAAARVAVPWPSTSTAGRCSRDSGRHCRRCRFDCRRLQLQPVWYCRPRHGGGHSRRRDCDFSLWTSPCLDVVGGAALVGRRRWWLWKGAGGYHRRRCCLSDAAID